jgi:hypothetical protein
MMALALVFACGACVRLEAHRDASHATVGGQVAAARAASHPSETCLASLLQRIVDVAGVEGVQRLHIGPVAREGEGEFVRVYWPQQRAIVIVNLDDTAPPCAPAEADSTHERAALSWYRSRHRR